MNVFVGLPGDVLIQISETQRKLTAEVDGVVSNSLLLFFFQVFLSDWIHKLDSLLVLF